MGEKIKTANWDLSTYQDELISGDISQKSFLTQGDLGKAIAEIEDVREGIMIINDRENFKKKLNIFE